MRNQKTRENTASGLKGITWLGRIKKWRARITINRIERHLGVFDEKEDAHEAYRKASILLHGEFGRI